MAARTKTPGTTLEPISREVWRVAAVIVFGAFMANLDTSLVNVGLATVGRSLHSSLGSTQWITSGYLIALAGALPVGAWLGRRIGVGTLWLCALVGFTVTSLLCALAPDLGFLIALRIAQGVMGGLLVPAGQTVVGGVAGPGRMGRVMNTVGIAVVLAPAIGPAIGGLLIAHLSWRWLFLINVPVGALALVLGLRVIPRGERDTAGPFDLIGFLLVSAGLPALTYGIIEASQRHSATAGPASAALLAGFALMVSFVARSLRRDHPLLDLRLFTNRIYTAAATSVFFSGAALFGGLIVLPLYYEILRGKGVVETGLLLITYGAGAAVALRLGGRLTDRIGGGITTVMGLAITVASTLPMAFLGADASLTGVTALQCVRGIGLGLSGLPALSVAYATVARPKLGDATAQASILQRVGGSLGSALFVVILENRGHTDLHSFHTTFAWLTAATAAALLVAGWLTLEQRRAA